MQKLLTGLLPMSKGCDCDFIVKRKYRKLASLARSALMIFSLHKAGSYLIFSASDARAKHEMHLRFSVPQKYLCCTVQVQVTVL
jgi:hypothetical protein